MTMNKAERARLEELEAALAAATVGAKSYPAPKPMTREEVKAALVPVKMRDPSVYRHGRRVALGWGFNDYLGGFGSKGEVFPMWKDELYSGHGHTGDGGSQRSGPMYRTKREAAIALRLALQRQCGEILAAADQLIRDSGK